ncbi:IS701 family transposase [Actinomadura darangshiensis]|uniref:IS701 family transposase n=1 Tax=Actinomadura darangshiensis TaxID=705336 RepID=A0A4R5BV83_9ACTN|nr:IS701 family transposase [Actinomadura darangshiensis]TDD89616.1 IS701 family transposase [Actinomadura darangshiensis]
MAPNRHDLDGHEPLDPAHEPWLHHIHRQIEYRFSRSEPRARAYRYVRGLLSHLGRKNSWQIARQAGEARPDGMQRLLAAARWDENLVRDDLRQLMVENLYDGNNLMIATECDFIKKGNKSVGVHRQFSSETRKLENSQTGAFLLYADSSQNVAPIDRELYLPKEWADNHVRRARARVPSGLSYAPKAQLATTMLERAIAARVPASGVVSDQMYGADRALRERLEELGVPYVLGVPERHPVALPQANRVVQVTAGQIAARVPHDLWLRLTSGAGTATSSWAWAQLHSENDAFGRWLLIRRGLGGPFRLRYCLCFQPRDVHPVELIRLTSRTDQVIGAFRDLQKRVGLDHYEVRLWTAWYRHVTLAMAAVDCVALSDLHRGARLLSPGLRSRAGETVQGIA